MTNDHVFDREPGWSSAMYTSYIIFGMERLQTRGGGWGGRGEGVFTEDFAKVFF